MVGSCGSVTVHEIGKWSEPQCCITRTCWFWIKLSPTTGRKIATMTSPLESKCWSIHYQYDVGQFGAVSQPGDRGTTEILGFQLGLTSIMISLPFMSLCRGCNLLSIETGYLPRLSCVSWCYQNLGIATYIPPNKSSDWCIKILCKRQDRLAREGQTKGRVCPMINSHPQMLGWESQFSKRWMTPVLKPNRKRYLMFDLG